MPIKTTIKLYEVPSAVDMIYGHPSPFPGVSGVDRKLGHGAIIIITQDVKVKVCQRWCIVLNSKLAKHTTLADHALYILNKLPPSSYQMQRLVNCNDAILSINSKCDFDF